MNYLVAVDYCFLDRPAGAARVAWDIACLMRDEGWRVAALVAHPPGGGARPDDETLDGVRVVRYHTPRLPGWHPLRAHAYAQAAADAVHRSLHGDSWDLAHAHVTYPGLGLARALGDAPRYVYTMHSPIVLENRFNWAHEGWTGRLKLTLGLGKLRRDEGRFLHRCEGIHTLSHFTRSHVQRDHGLGHRVTIIPHWRRVDLRRDRSRVEARRALGWPLDEKILFTVRHHGRRYGLDLAVRAVAPLVRDPGCSFVVGGDGPLRPALEALAADLGVSDRVRFPGRLSDEQLNLAYQAADLFVLPTLALECFGLITVEALSFGLPVVATDAGAIPEVLADLSPELIVPAGDVEALRARLDDVLRGRLPLPSEEAMIDYVERRFSREAVAPQIIRFLQQAAQGRAARAVDAVNV